MVGKVFISCGQRQGERAIAEKIKALLHEKFSLGSYLAFKVQGLDDIMTITEELKSCDYYLFIDFYRKKKFLNILKKDRDDLACSLFTHQELALAHHVGFRDIIALQEEGAPLEGFLRYVLSNPEHFKTEEELLKKVEDLVRDKKWNKGYSRNLISSEIERVFVPQYSDHEGNPNMEFIWHVKIENKRPDIAALNTVCRLDSIEFPNGEKSKCYDKSFLKWAQHDNSYLTTILPLDNALLDVFAIHADGQGVFLHSALDQFPRQPILDIEGKHKLTYKLFSDGFPLLTFCIEIDYHKTTDFRILPNDQVIWKNDTQAHLLV